LEAERDQTFRADEKLLLISQGLTMEASAAFVSPSAGVGAKRKLPEPPAAGAGGGAVAAAGAGAAPVAIELDARTENMTVEEYLRDYLEKLIEGANESVDDAVDTVSLLFKQLREETQNYRHHKKAELAAKNKAARKKVWDVQLTVEEAGESTSDLVGKSFLISPRQVSGASSSYGAGMCKIGRSSGDDFKGSKGVSLAKDYSVSTWHGKVSEPLQRCSLAGGSPATPSSNPPTTTRLAVHVRIRGHLLHGSKHQERQPAQWRARGERHADPSKERRCADYRRHCAAHRPRTRGPARGRTIDGRGGRGGAGFVVSSYSCAIFGRRGCLGTCAARIEARGQGRRRWRRWKRGS